MPHEPNRQETDESSSGRSPDHEAAPTPVVVRRSAVLAAVIGGAASAVAIAYLWRGSQTGQALDWALCGVMAVVAVVYLAGLVDSRTPLLVADTLGVRIRLGHEWRGLPWDAIDKVVVQPSRGPLRDGRLMVVPHSLGRALDGLDTRGGRLAAMNQRRYGAALGVPLGMTTRVSGDEDRTLVEGLSTLSLGQVEVVELAEAPVGQLAERSAEGTVRTDLAEPALVVGPVPAADTSDPASETSTPHGEAAGKADDGHAADPGAAEPVGSDPLDDDPEAVGADPLDDVEPDPNQDVHEDELDHPGRTGDPVRTADPTAADSTAARDDAAPRLRSLLGGLGTVISRVAKGRSQDVDAEAVPQAEADAPTMAGEPVSPLRSTRRAQRAEVTRDAAASLGSVALHPRSDDVDARLPEGRELRRPGSVDLVVERVDTERVRPISQFGDPVEPLVIDDFVTEPAYDPVIGPELAAARTRLGLSVDELAERTRIRPHVIESIEVDDFAPCGGDVYARGHLRTLARVLGKDVQPMLDQFQERYATAPVTARRVFEAELATGMTGSMRSTIGGPNWGLLVGVVLSLVLVWGVVRLVAGTPDEVIESPAPVLNGSAGVAQPPAHRVTPPARRVTVTLVAARGESTVVVRDARGEVVFRGDLTVGERKRLRATPPVRVRAADAGAIEVRVKGRDRGPLGELGQPGRRTFRVAAR